MLDYINSIPTSGERSTENETNIPETMNANLLCFSEFIRRMFMVLVLCSLRLHGTCKTNRQILLCEYTATVSNFHSLGNMASHDLLGCRQVCHESRSEDSEVRLNLVLPLNRRLVLIAFAWGQHTVYASHMLGNIPCLLMQRSVTRTTQKEGFSLLLGVARLRSLISRDITDSLP